MKRKLLTMLLTITWQVIHVEERMQLKYYFLANITVIIWARNFNGG